MNRNLDILKVISNNIMPDIGKILIAEPLLDDLYFGRSVVFLIDEVDDSFMGLVLNNISDILLKDVIHGFDNSELPLFVGGPVNPDVLYYIHTNETVTGAEKIAENIYYGGDLDEIRMLVHKGLLNNTNIKFFIGSSGWAPGQLCQEISFNSWLVSNTPSVFLFTNHLEMWSESLGFVDQRYEVWKNFPRNPDYN